MSVTHFRIHEGGSEELGSAISDQVLAKGGLSSFTNRRIRDEPNSCFEGAFSNTRGDAAIHDGNHRNVFLVDLVHEAERRSPEQSTPEYGSGEQISGIRVGNYLGQHAFGLMDEVGAQPRGTHRGGKPISGPPDAVLGEAAL
jgi:hypothetical protein